MRRENSGIADDLLSGLVFAQDAEDRLRQHELLAMIYLLITAGYKTMVSFMTMESCPCLNILE